MEYSYGKKCNEYSDKLVFLGVRHIEGIWVRDDTEKPSLVKKTLIPSYQYFLFMINSLDIPWFVLSKLQNKPIQLPGDFVSGVCIKYLSFSIHIWSQYLLHFSSLRSYLWLVNSFNMEKGNNLHIRWVQNILVHELNK